MQQKLSGNLYSSRQPQRGYQGLRVSLRQEKLTRPFHSDGSKVAWCATIRGRKDVKACGRQADNTRLVGPRRGTRRREGVIWPQISSHVISLTGWAVRKSYRVRTAGKTVRDHVSLVGCGWTIICCRFKKARRTRTAGDSSSSNQSESGRGLFAGITLTGLLNQQNGLPQSKPLQLVTPPTCSELASSTAGLSGGASSSLTANTGER